MKKTLFLLFISLTIFATAQAPAGSNGEIQYNSNGSFGASPNLKTSGTLLSLLDIGSTSAKIHFQSESGDNSYIFSENYGSNSNRLVFQTTDDGENDYSVFRNQHWNQGAKDVFEIHRSWTKANSNFYVTENIGIGTTNPFKKLTIQDGQLFFGHSSVNQFESGRLRFGEYTNSYQGAFIHYDGSSNVFNIGVHQANSIDPANDINAISILRNGGNVGFGTNTPQANLHIKSDNYQDFIVFDRTSKPEMDNLIYLTPSWDNDQNDQLRFLIGNQIIASFEETGNVGIGTHNPLKKMDIRGDMILDASRDPHLFTGTSSGESNRYLKLLNSPSHSSASGLMAGGILVADSYSYASPGKNDLIVKGKVAINTTTTGTHKLAVEGTIGAREIKVELGSWSDFVFYNDYNLPSLEEVEKFITKNNHLPEIPSEAEVLEEGINLGEMNAKLLQKIEELTLYLIEQNKRINSLEKKLAEKE